MDLITILLVLIIAGLIFYILKLKKSSAVYTDEEKKKMEDRRSSFISIISHQLRTPLSVIKGYLEALSTGDQGKLTAGQQEYLEEALKINVDTIKLVNDYLSVVQLDSDNIPVKPEAVAIDRMVRELIGNMKVLAKAYNCNLQFDEPTERLPEVYADPIKIRQVLENIIANAIKYTSGRGAARVALEQQGDFVQLTCRDSGVGIPVDQQGDLFTKFFRARNVINKDTKGSGLGLYIAKVIVKSLGGSIWLESREGSGTTVFIKLKVYHSNGKQ